jgi:D-alanyl-lipoteichoic acid acyltransferase DltB (MBOAT superfamily)
MLFGTPEFIFLFLPAALILHFTLARRSQDAAIVATTLSSLFYYAWWNPPFVVLPVASIAANFALARLIARSNPGRARLFATLGVIANLAVLGYFKYADFLLSIWDGHKPAPPDVPLALSFTTFVQVAFLVHVYQRRERIDFTRYALFVAFFPHLIAGPIVRWSAFGRQIGDPGRRALDWSNLAQGLTLFTFGLAMKVLVADPLAPHVGTVFDAAARGAPLTAIAAWGGCVAFTLQIYFDFCGYSCMAVGLGLLFNYRLPINFAAPLRSTNIADFWRRWHITLSRLCRDLIYVPLAKGRGPLRRWFSLWLTMLVVGIWHGAGWTFVLWGAYNGVLLLIHAWWRDLFGSGRHHALGGFVGWVLTFGSFAAGMALFRAADLQASWGLLSAMSGFGGAPVAEHHFEADDWMIRHGYVPDLLARAWFGDFWSMNATLATLAILALVLIMPDPMEVTDYREGDAQSDWRRRYGGLAWRPSLLGLAISLSLFAAVFVNIGRVTEFFYYQF